MVHFICPSIFICVTTSLCSITIILFVYFFVFGITINRWNKTEIKSQPEIERKKWNDKTLSLNGVDTHITGDWLKNVE